MSPTATKFSPIQPKHQHLSPATFFKPIAISSISFFLVFTFLHNHPYNQAKDLSIPFIDYKWPSSSPPNVTINYPSNISHIMFVMVGSIETWKYRRSYIEAWWKENKTRGNLWLDVAPAGELLPWPSSSPPFRVNEDITKLDFFPKIASPVVVRIYRSILETYRLGDNKDVRWYVMVDDDTLVFLDNLLQVLGKYDHSKYYYIGTNSESIRSNIDFSFDMGYGGAGYALSYSLVEALAPKIDGCIERYPHLYVSDFLSYLCLADLGVDLTTEKGIHQIDFHGDLSGLLSSHPNTPSLTLHHFDSIDPIFPSKTRSESINHLMKAANIDQSRLFQQTICYYRQENWTFSISWGYSAHIYESIFPRSFLRKPLETFLPWKNEQPPMYMFNTRWLNNDPCEAPHVFFMEKVESSELDEVVVSTYGRSWQRNLPPCSINGNHSADPVVNIQVLSSVTERKEAERMECCDVEYMADRGIAEVTLRACLKGEMMA